MTIIGKCLENNEVLLPFDNDVYKIYMDLVKKSIAIIKFYGII